jgi:hypothetical protein
MNLLPIEMEEKAIFDLSTMGNVKRLITRRIPEPWNRDGEAQSP